MKIIKTKIESNEIEVYLSEDNESAWLTAKEISRLYNLSLPSVYRYIDKVRGKNEKDENKMRTNEENLLTYSISLDKKRRAFSFDLVFKIGKMIESNKGTLLKEKIDEILLQENSKIAEKTPQNIRIFDNGKLKLNVEVSPEEDTVWLNQGQIALLFETTQQNISTHIKKHI